MLNMYQLRHQNLKDFMPTATVPVVITDTTSTPLDTVKAVSVSLNSKALNAHSVH